jgi:hypothetical protein
MKGCSIKNENTVKKTGVNLSITLGGACAGWLDIEMKSNLVQESAGVS